MHEFGIASRLIEAATETAATHDATRIMKLIVRIGVLRQIDEHLLTEAFDHLRRDTICEGAVLEVVKCQAQAVCPKCGKAFDVRNWEWQCSDCSVDGDFVGGGDELELLSIDAEVDE